MKKAFSLTVLSALVLPFVLAPVAQAEDVQPAQTGHGNVTFKQHEDPAMRLRIENVSDIYFEELVIGGDDQVHFGTYSEQLKNDEGLYLAPNATIVDDRGTLQGWHLNASIGEFVDQAGKADPLTGTKLAVKATRGEAVTAGAIIDAADFPTALVELGTAAKTVLSVSEGKGYGTQTYYFGDDSQEATDLTKGLVEMNEMSNPDVTLLIPGNIKKDPTATYVADLTWTLADEPSI